MQDQPEPRDRSTTTVVILLIALVAVVIFVVARGKDEPSSDETPFQTGKRIFHSICINCHHPDPAKELSDHFTHGPPIAGSSFELIKMRVLSTSYPKGYKPKRKSQFMTTFEMTDAELRGLHAFVNDPRASNPDDEDEEEDKEDSEKGE